MEKARKTAAEIERTGAIEVSVKNPETVGLWTLEIDGSQRGQTSGRSLAVTDVLAGIRKLKVSGRDAQGKMLSDEKTVKVEGGATVTKELELNQSNSDSISSNASSIAYKRRSAWERFQSAISFWIVL
jgi:hypothetical protein